MAHLVWNDERPVSPKLSVWCGFDKFGEQLRTDSQTDAELLGGHQSTFRWGETFLWKVYLSVQV